MLPRLDGGGGAKGKRACPAVAKTRVMDRVKRRRRHKNSSSSFLILVFVCDKVRWISTRLFLLPSLSCSDDDRSVALGNCFPPFFSGEFNALSLLLWYKLGEARKI